MASTLQEIDKYNQLCLYADDANIKISHNNLLELQKLSETFLNITNKFLKDKNLLLNASKTNYIIFDLKKKYDKQLDDIKFTLEVENQILEMKQSVKFLGLIIDNQLSWTQHVDSICRKLSSGLFALRKMSFYCDIDTLIMLYYAYIHSHIQFGLQVYGGTSHSNLERILIAQKKAIRIMLKLKNYESCREKFRELKILTVFSLYVFQVIKYAKFNESKFHKHNQKHSHYTRNNDKFAIESHRTELFTKLPSQIGTKLLNSLPGDIRMENDIEAFNKKLKTLLCNWPLYSVQEFFDIC